MTRRLPEQSLLAGTLTTFRRRCGKPRLPLRRRRPARDPGVALHRGRAHQADHPRHGRRGRGGCRAGPLRAGPGRTGCGRRRGGGGVALPAGRPARGQPAMTGGPPSAETDAFVASRALFGSTLHWLDGAEAAALDHAQLETQLQGKGRELLRQLFQDSMDLRAHRERPRAEVVGADAVVRTRVESGHTRALTTVFGEVSVVNGVSGTGPSESAPGRRRVEPTGRETLARVATTGRDRSRPRLVRRHGRRDRPLHRRRTR